MWKELTPRVNTNGWVYIALFVFTFTPSVHPSRDHYRCNVKNNTCAVGLVRTNHSKLLHTKDNKTCRCPPRNSNADMSYHCHENGTIHIQSGRWAYEQHGSIHTMPCPFGYCFCKGQTKYGYCILDLKKQCAQHRKGTLCSKCEDGFSVLFGSEGCRVCHDNYLWLLLGGVVLMSIAVCALFYFNFDAFSGYLNAFIYSYQMMVLLIPANVELNPISSLVIYLFALQGTGNTNGVCLFHRMDNLQKLGFSYLIPGYLFVFTVFMGNIGYGLVVNLWKKIKKVTCVNQENNLETDEDDTLQIDVSRRKSFGSAFSFVLVVSYSYFTHITLDIMNFTKFKDTYVVHKAAFVIYCDSVHGWYFGLACVVLIFVVILFPAVLLFKTTFERIFPVLYRSEPIFNSLRLCFRDNCQCFAAFYFICRLVLLLVNMFCKDQVVRMIFLSMFSMAFLVFFILIQPYRISTYNMWDIMQLGNLCVISNISLIIQLRLIVKEKIRKRCMVFLNMFVFLPLIIAILRLVAYIKRLCTKSTDNDERTHQNDNAGNAVTARIARFRDNRKIYATKGIKRSAFVPERVYERFERDTLRLGNVQDVTSRSCSTNSS